MPQLDARRDYQFVYEEVQGAAGSTTVQYSCPTGCTVRVVQAIGYHDHAGALAGRFRLNDTLGDIHELHTDVSVAASARCPLYAQIYGESIVLRAPWILEFAVTGIGGGEHVYLLVLLEVRKGDTSYT